MEYGHVPEDKLMLPFQPHFVNHTSWQILNGDQGYGNPGVFVHLVRQMCIANDYQWMNDPTIHQLCENLYKQEIIARLMLYEGDFIQISDTLGTDLLDSLPDLVKVLQGSQDEAVSYRNQVMEVEKQVKDFKAELQSIKDIVETYKRRMSTISSS